MKHMTLTPDLNAAQAFLDMLDPEGVFTFQTFDDDKDRKNLSLARVFHGTLDQHHADLTRLQQRGAGIFVMINKGDGVVHTDAKTCRTAKNVVAIRALWGDLDGAPLEPVLAAHHPDIVVESSPGKWHTYWLTNDCPREDFNTRQLQIAQKFDSDKAVADLPRVMRLAGFWHQKAAPFLTRTIFPGAAP